MSKSLQMVIIKGRCSPSRARRNQTKTNDTVDDDDNKKVLEGESEEVGGRGRT